MNVYLVEILICILCSSIKQNYQTLYFQLAHNKFSFVFYFRLNHHTLLFCILCLKKNTITICPVEALIFFFPGGRGFSTCRA